jgi:hypothetical protein
MTITIESTQAPTVSCQGTNLTVTLDLQLSFVAVSSTGVTSPLFSLTSQWTYDPTFRFDAQHPFRWSGGNPSWSVQSSSVGPIDLSLLAAAPFKAYLGFAHP